MQGDREKQYEIECRQNNSPNQTSQLAKYNVVDIFSTDKIFNNKQLNLKYDEEIENNGKEFISNDTSSIGESHPMYQNMTKREQQNQDTQNQDMRQLENENNIVKQLIQRDSIQQSQQPSITQNHNDKDKDRYNKNKHSIDKQYIPESQAMMIHDSAFPLSKMKETSDEQQTLFQSQKKKETGKSQALMNLKLIAQIRKKVNYFYKNFTSSGRKSYLTNHNVRHAINDKSDIIQLDRNVFIVQRILYELKYRLKRVDLHVHKYIELFDPHSLTSYIILRFLAIYNAIFYLLYSIMIIFHGPEWFQSIWYVITLMIWVFETFYHLNTKIYVDNQLVSDRFHIVTNYIKSRALYDFISFILLATLPSIETGRNIFYALAFIKLCNTMYDYNEIQKDLIMQVKNYYMVSLVNLIIQVFVIGHVIACMYYLVGQIELKWMGLEETWYDQGLGSDYVWWKLYLEAMYWALTLLTTGSNIAFTLFQMFFTTFIMIFTTIVFGYLLNVTGVIISQLNQQNENMRKDLNIINDYMRSNKISKSVRSRVNTDIENYYASNMNKQQEEEQQIISKISPTLQDLIRMEYCNQFLDKFPIIREKFSKGTIEKLCHEFEESYYLPNQIIFLEGQPNDLGLLYIAQGSVSLKQTFLDEIKNQKTLTKLKKGSIFGTINFFTGLAPDKSAISNEFTKVVRINRNKFIEIVSEDEKDYQVFCQIKDKLLIYENFDVIGQKCLFCQNSTHLEVECHLIHIQKDEIYQKLRFFENKSQSRGAYIRKQSYLKTYTTFLKVKNEVEFYREKHRQTIDDLGQQFNSTHNSKHQHNMHTNTDYVTSDEYDDDEDEDNQEEEEDQVCSQDNSQHQLEIESNAGTIHSQKKENLAHLDRDIIKNYHNKSQEISDILDSKLSQGSPEILAKHFHHQHNNNNNNNLNEEGILLDSVHFREKNGRKQNKALSFILSQEQHQKRGSNYSKQSTLTTKVNHYSQDNQLINLNEEDDDYVDSLPQSDRKPRKSNKLPTLVKADSQQQQQLMQSQKKRGSIFSKMRNNTEENSSSLQNQNNILLYANSTISSNDKNKEKKQQIQLNKQPTMLAKLQSIQLKPRSTLDYIQDNFKQIIKNETQQQILVYSEWDFDMLNDWKYYFPSGNSKVIFQRYVKYQRTKLKMQSTKRKQQPLVQTIKLN